jgi:hypothetical protein
MIINLMNNAIGLDLDTEKLPSPSTNPNSQHGVILGLRPDQS